VVFETYVEDFGLIGVLASVTDMNFIPLKSSNDSATYLYPQSLSKQLNLNGKPDYKKNDFLMLINSIYFQDGNRDLRKILIHELLHGLGFGSGITMSKMSDEDTSEEEENSIISNDGSDYAFIPSSSIAFYDEKKLVEIKDKNEFLIQYYNTEITEFLPYEIFDKYLVSMKSGEKLLSDIEFYSKELNQKCLPKDGSPLLIKDSTNKFMKDCFDQLSPETQETVKQIINDYFFKAHSLGFQTDNGDIVQLQTFDDNFYSTSSISHPNDVFEEWLQQTLKEDQDSFIANYMDLNTHKFKMEKISSHYDENYILYSENNDTPMEDMLKYFPNNKNHPLIGDGIVNVLKTLGWTEKGGKKGKEIYDVDETVQVPESKKFEYEYKIMKEIMSQGHPDLVETTTDVVVEEEPTFIMDEIKTLDDFYTDIYEVDDDETTLSSIEESDYDDSEEETEEKQ